jgi:RNA polymerase sigma factor (sigma-70 family)
LADTAADNGTLLRSFLEAETEALLGTLRLYVLRSGLAAGQGADLAAVELLNDVVVEALAHADLFRPSGQPKAWLLGIAANLVKRRQVARAKKSRREPLVHDLLPGSQEIMSEDEVFDRLAALAARQPEVNTEGDPARGLVSSQQVEAILAHVSKADRQVLRLAVLHELNGQELAAALGISPGAARVRLHRALNHLRAAWPIDEPGRGEVHG